MFCRPGAGLINVISSPSGSHFVFMVRENQVADALEMHDGFSSILQYKCCTSYNLVTQLKVGSATFVNGSVND